MAWFENVDTGMSAWRAARGRRTFIINGDSVATGTGATNPATEGFAYLLYNYFCGLYGGVSSSWVKMDDPGWTFTGSWIVYIPEGLFKYTVVAANADTASYTATCCGFDFYYKLLSMTREFTISIDGGTPESVGGAYSSGNPYQKWSWAGEMGEHTITITAPNSAYVVDACALDIVTNLDAGVSLLDAGVAGSVIPSSVDYTQCMNGVPNPLHIVEFTLNNYYAQTALVTYAASMQTFCANPPGSQIILAVHERNISRAIPQSSYDDICRTVALANNSCFINTHEHWGTWPTANANGWMTDEAHPSTLGHAKLAQDIEDVIWYPMAVHKDEISPMAWTMRGDRRRSNVRTYGRLIY